MIEPDDQKRLLAEYLVLAKVYEDFTATVARLLKQILAASGVQIHSITHRPKAVESLRIKLAKPEKAYSALADITDLAAVRITTYFADDVDLVAKVVEAEFDIDSEKSIDKQDVLDPDRFGYRSLHYVAELSSERAELTEYSRFRALKVEIQVRSILQHAWAEIEHDLGYKSAAGVPKAIRRRFARIAGLLELADDEFGTIRRELVSYAASVQDGIRSHPEEVGIDKISLQALVSTDSFTHKLSSLVAAAAGASLEPTDDSTAERSVNLLHGVGIGTIADLEHVAATQPEIVGAYATHWLAGSEHTSLHEGIGILYLTYVLLAQRGDENFTLEFLKTNNIGSDPERDQLVTRIMDTYRAAVANSV